MKAIFKTTKGCFEKGGSKLLCVACEENLERHISAHYQETLTGKSSYRQSCLRTW